MFGHQHGTGIEHEHAQVRVAVDFLRAVRAEHSGANHDDVERDAAVLRCFIPSAAKVTPDHVEREFGFLHLHAVVRIGRRDQSGEVNGHDTILFVGFGVRRRHSHRTRRSLRP